MSTQTANVLNLGKTPVSTVLKLAWPTILEQIAFTVLTFADTAMVGILGAVCTAAVGITAPLLWLAGGIFSSVSIGFSVVVAQNVGANNMDKASRTVSVSIMASSTVGLILALVGLILSPVLPVWLGAEGQVAGLATQYFAVMSLSCLANSISTNISGILRSTGDTKTPLIANSIAIVLNIVLNFLFIFPSKEITLLGATIHTWGLGLGVAGAAMATALSIATSAMIMIPSLLSAKRGIKIDTKLMLHPEKELLKEVSKLSIPIAMERVTLGIGQVFYMWIVATLGTTAVAAHHLAVQAESLSYLPAFGFSVAVTTLVGQSIGADDRAKARVFGKIGGNMGAVLMGLTGILLFVFAEPLLGILTQDVAVIAVGATLLRIVAFAQPAEACAIIYAGALRGAGDTKWPFYINLIGVWGLRIGLSTLFVFGFGFGLNAVWIAMLIDLSFRGYVCRKRFLHNVI